jgi:FAD/FMN-containing dehydrogenase
LLPSEGTCTIGGNLSTNAGGTAAIAHGIARSHALGLEVVLADGRVLHDLNKLKKNNTGYDLRDLFIGAEGTLGIITAAVLKLVPRPRATETAYVGLASPDAALRLLTIAEQRLPGGVTSFELIARVGIEAAIKYVPGVRDPLGKPYEWYVLLELVSPAKEGLHDVMEEILAAGAEQRVVLDATIAASLEQAKAFWFIRENFAEVQRRLGASIKHDVSVPVAAVPQFIAEANAAVTKLIPGSIPLPFGHAGDGNIHYNVTQPPGADRDQFLKRWDEVNKVVFEIVTKLGGSISAEHGIGVQKRDKLPKYKDPVALDLMRTLKRALDPNNILNPGKVL